ncbi:MAG: hypothetical protein PHU12_02280 [Candidatus Aenigmarchaeota archaeon]|nr:hypothetical protein [Candidatus Aenigmarchaeota archaeon]
MDKNYVLDFILTGTIEFTEHTNEIEDRKGRPSREFVNEYMINNIRNLYKIEDVFIIWKN